MHAVRRRAWTVLLCAVFAGVRAAVLAPIAFSTLSTGGAVATGTEADWARQQAERLGVPTPDLVLSVSGTASETVPAGAGALVTALSRQHGAGGVWSAQTTGDPWLRSKEGRTLLVGVRLKGTDKERKQVASEVVARARATAPGLGVEPSGAVWANRAIDEAIERDLHRAELLAAPALFIVLVLAYGSMVSALLPVIVAALAVGCTLSVLGLLAQLTEVSRVGRERRLSARPGQLVVPSPYPAPSRDQPSCQRNQELTPCPGFHPTASDSLPSRQAYAWVLGCATEPVLTGG